MKARRLLTVVLACMIAAGAASVVNRPLPEPDALTAVVRPVLSFAESRASARLDSSQQTARVAPARQGRKAASYRVRFQPDLLVLPGSAEAEVVPARTKDDALQVPEDVDRLGWWDGSAYAGDPFGTTVIAGHVDSATEGIGFFARLLRIEVGQRVTVRGDDHRATYRVTSVRLVDKQALATDSEAFDQTGKHRLVLITCAGRYRPERGGYDSNLVVVAKPVGAAT